MDRVLRRCRGFISKAFKVMGRADLLVIVIDIMVVCECEERKVSGCDT